jgi:hypothetical protein
VLWGKGQLVIVEPTVKQIAALFGVSVPTLRAAIREAKALEADAELRAAAWLKPLMRPRRVRNRIDELV